MNKTAVLIGIVILLGLFFWFFNKPVSKSDLLSPTVQSPPTPTPAPTPKTFKYDASTDLRQELEKVNPQVLESDFE